MRFRFIALLGALLAIGLAQPPELTAARRKAAARSSRSSVSAAREALNEGRNSDALLSYKRQLDRKDDAAARCEYAFVLAKLGLKDAALAQLDLAYAGKRPPSGSSGWFRARILRAAGAEAAADELGQDQDAPSWLKKRELDALPDADGDLNERFINANRLAAQGQQLQAVVEFSSALRQRSDDALGWIGVSLPLEKIGALKSAKAALERASGLSGGDAEMKDLVRSRRAQMGAEADEEGRRSRRKKVMQQSAANSAGRTLLFGGGSFGGGTSSLAGRFGYFLTPTLDAAIDVSLSNMGGTGGSGQQLGGGASTRFYWPTGDKGGAIALGGRVGYFSKQTTVTISPGFTSPMGDFFIDVSASETSYQIGITVGATSYFGGAK